MVDSDSTDSLLKDHCRESVAKCQFPGEEITIISSVIGVSTAAIAIHFA